jgi:hypothetical protein
MIMIQVEYLLFAIYAYIGYATKRWANGVNQVPSNYRHTRKLRFTGYLRSSQYGCVKDVRY